MIAFALPWVLGAAMAGVLTITALHLLSVRRPPELLLPTARFLPERDVRAVSRTRRPSDILLLLVRIAALATAGLAAAAPAWRTTARERLTLVVADGLVISDSAAMRALVQPGGSRAGSRMAFARAGAARDAFRGDDPAALFPVAWREAARLVRDEASIDSIDLHLLLATAPGTGDEGFAAWRAAWPGRVTTHQVAADVAPRRVVVVAGDTVGVRDVDDDPVRTAFTWHAARVSHPGAAHTDTIVLARSDEPPATTNAGVTRGPRVSWPRRGVPAGWRATSGGTLDTALALAVGGRAVMGPFRVTAVRQGNGPEGADSSATPIAWWSDGRVAATERRTGSGCDRDVGVVSESASDVLLSPSANALFDRLLAPCVRRAPIAVSALRVASASGLALADAGIFRGDAGRRGAGDSRGTSWIVPLLFASSLLLLVVEWRLRRRVLEGTA